MKRKLGRKNKYRKMMMRSLITSVILYEKIITTDAKAKEARGLIDKVINLGKNKTLAAQRKLLAFLTHKNAWKKINDVLVDRYKDRVSGYSRIYKLSPRLGDGAVKTVIELVKKEENKSKRSIQIPKTKAKKDKK